MTRYEVVVTFFLDADCEEGAQSIIDGLILPDPSVDENQIDYIVSNALEVD